MNELDILTTFFPLFFLSFGSLKDLRKFLGWCAVILALICNANQMRIFLDDPLKWIPVASFLGSVSLFFLSRKNPRAFLILGILFTVQALLTVQLPVMII